MEQVDSHFVRRIVSGGQTGVDRGGLEAAIALGIEHGGWCPRGRIAEDGSIPPDYRLIESASSDYWVRTEQNVVDSDGTILLYRDTLSGGTKFTQKMAKKHSRPYCLVNLNSDWEPRPIRQWLNEHQISVLNVAGPRESSQPGIFAESRDALVKILDNSSAAPKNAR